MIINPTKKYTGMILSDGILYLYESADDLREEMILRGKNWQQIAWINSVVFCDKDKNE